VKFRGAIAIYRLAPIKLNPTPILTLTLLIDKGYALKFADDSKIFGKVITPVDRLQLQQDHDALCKWAQDWQMKFNVSKCKVMHTGPGNTNCSYFMNGQLLNSVTEHKDLAVIISSNIKVADHCHYACNKANKMLGMIKRTIKHRNTTVVVQLYKSLVRPSLVL